jgi:SAM-dependent methyltransferase
MTHESSPDVLSGTRPLRWEDDFSRNALDDAPFRNRPPVNGLRPGQYSHWRRLIDSADVPGGDAEIGSMIARDIWPIPCAADRENYMPNSDAGYWLSGLGDCLKVMRAARECGSTIHSLLDFGCASGRVTRHFCVQSQIPEVWGTDINARHVRWLAEFMPCSLRPVFNTSLPSLPLPDASLDAVCAFSVFTHIDTFETAWLAELRRVIRPGGLCYLTVHNEDTWDALRSAEPDNRLVRSMTATGKFTPDMLHGPMPGERLVYRFSETGPYRSQVFHSNAWLERTWGRFFDIQQIIPAGHQRQSVVVMTRPQATPTALRRAA